MEHTSHVRSARGDMSCTLLWTGCYHFYPRTVKRENGMANVFKEFYCKFTLASSTNAKIITAHVKKITCTPSAMYVRT